MFEAAPGGPATRVASTTLPSPGAPPTRGGDTTARAIEVMNAGAPRGRWRRRLKSTLPIVAGVVIAAIGWLARGWGDDADKQPAAATSAPPLPPAELPAPAPAPAPAPEPHASATVSAPPPATSAPVVRPRVGRTTPTTSAAPRVPDKPTPRKDNAFGI